MESLSLSIGKEYGYRRDSAKYCKISEVIVSGKQGHSSLPDRNLVPLTVNPKDQSTKNKKDRHMISFNEVGTLLDDIAEELPIDFYKELNGGINLLPDTKMHPESNKSANLYILGEYHNDSCGLGRYINIYYGSFISLFGCFTTSQQKNELRQILVHEFTHHLESLAGESGLEKKDLFEMGEYKRKCK